MPRLGSVCEERVCRVPKLTSFAMSPWMRWASISRSIARSAGDGPWGWLPAERALVVGAADDGTATAAATARTSPADSATRRTLDMVPSCGWLPVPYPRRTVTGPRVSVCARAAGLLAVGGYLTVRSAYCPAA